MKTAPPTARGRRLTPRLESLEAIRLLSCATIGGTVYADSNNNGLLDAAETPIANSTIALKNASGVVVGTATTGADGSYSFATDSTISTAATTQTQTATIPATDTNFSQAVSINQFNPALGTLLSVQVTESATYTTAVKAENLGPTPQTVSASSTGTFTLSAPGLGVASATPTAVNGQQTIVGSPLSSSITLTAGPGTVNPYKGGNPTITVGGQTIILPNFTGSDTVDFGSRSSTKSASGTVTDAASLAAYTGTGPISQLFAADAVTSDSGNGNVAFQISTQAGATISVVYSYIPNNCLKPGNYTIVQTQEPAGYIDGQESSGGVVIPNSVGTDVIPVTLGTANSVGNNFGELIPGRVTGTVFVDTTGNGFSADDTAFAGVSVTLTGKTAAGVPVTLTTPTAADGSYSFGSLYPGTYTVSEAVPNGYVETGPTNSTSYTVTTGQGTVSPNNNFDNAMVCNHAAVTGVVYYVTDNGVTTAYSDLRGHTRPGDTVTAQFTVAPGSAPITLSLVSYTAPAASFDPNTAAQQAEYSVATGTFGPGVGSLTAVIPNSYYQIDFVCGTPIATFGPAGSNIFYSPQGRLFSADNSGSTLYAASISGSVFADTTGDGTSADDTPLAGVAVTLTGKTVAGAPVSLTTTTAVNGSYSFNNLLPGTYTVNQATPTGDVVTVGGPTTISTVTTPVTTGVNFDDYVPTCAAVSISGVGYTVVHNGVATSYTSLGGHVQPGDSVTVNFVVNGTASDALTLVAYAAPNSTLSSQYITGESTGTFAPGPHSLTVTVPNSGFQVDFVCGPAIGHFGPSGGSISYHGENRFIDSDANTGLGAPAAPPCNFTPITADVGGPGQGGTVAYGQNGVYTVQGGGSDIWNAADQFNYEYQTLSGDGEIVARVDNLTTGTDPWAKAGLMIRQSLDPSSPQAFIAQTACNGVAFQRREGYGQQSVHTGGWATNASQPVWLKLVRSGDTFTGFESTNGINWTAVGSDTIVMGQNVLVGLAVTAHNNGALATANFEGVSTCGYWASSAGQCLINSLNSGPCDAQLAGTLARLLPNVYGPSAGVNSLVGKTNADVAALARKLAMTGSRLDQDVLALALDAYVTNSCAAGCVAKVYGFQVGSNGFIAQSFNDWGAGAAFGLSNNTNYNVWQYLGAINAQASNGVLFASATAANKALAYSIIDQIIETGYLGGC